MKITLTKRRHRNRMVCTRENGSFISADLGGRLPHHDFSHFVIETALGLKQGFFGNLASGYTFEQLSDRQVIMTLSTEAWFAETLAGVLGSLENGACTTEEFPQLVKGAMSFFKDYDISKTPSPEQAGVLLEELRALLRRWEGLGDSESLILHFAT